MQEEIKEEVKENWVEQQPVVNNNFWKGLLFAVIVSIILWALLFELVLYIF